MKLTMFWKIYLTMLASFLVIVISISTIIVEQQINVIQKEKLLQNKLLVDLISKEIEARYYENKWPLESLARLASHNETLFWFIVRDNDGLIFLSDQSSLMGGRIQDHYPGIAASTDKEYLSLNQSRNSGIIVKHLDTGSTKWSFWYGFSLREVAARENQLVFLVATVSLASMIVLGIILFYSIKRYTRPIRRLISGATIIGRGNLYHRVKVESEDELSQLADAFNLMAEDLQSTTFSKDYVNNIIGSMIDSLIVIDPELRIEKINRSASKLTGYQENELVGNLLGTIIAAGDRDFYNELQSLRRLEKRHLENYETYISARDGRTIPILFNGSAIRDGEGSISHIVCVARDVSERKQVEEVLRERNAWINAILEASPAAIYSMDKEGIILSWNKGAELMFGWSRAEVIGKMHPIVPEEDRESFKANRVKIQKGEGFLGVELRRRKKDGSHIDINLSAAPVFDSSGAVTGQISVAIDITQQKTMEAEHAVLENQLRQAQKMEAIGQLAGGVAHDFNNILTAIIGFGSLINIKMPAGDPLSGYVKQILASAEKAAKLTQSLLAFSRKQAMNPSPVDVNDIVQDIKKFLDRIIGEDIEFESNVTGHALVVMADRGQIEQVLMNLVTNARDAMPHGGRLTITTEKTEMDEDAGPMRDAAAHSYAVIAVSDTGVGIDKKKMEHIFEPFFTTKEVGKGTGLGLSMAYGTIKQHAGFIDVRSETGRGSTFKIYLPLIESDACPAGEETSNALARGTESILLVEDDELVRTVTKAIIELLGYKVLEASNGKDAIALYRENNETVSLVITDVVMPGLSGMDTYNEIKKIKQDAKILFISGYTAEFLRNKGIQDEKINIVSKPLEVGHFSQKIREILDGHLR